MMDPTQGFDGIGVAPNPGVAALWTVPEVTHLIIGK